MRVIEYTGPRDIVERQIDQCPNGIKRSSNGLEIRAATIGNYPELLADLPVIEKNHDWISHPSNKPRDCEVTIDCGVTNPATRMICTQPFGHLGPHVAHGTSQQEIERWEAHS